jgi:hypothetical protein
VPRARAQVAGAFAAAAARPSADGPRSPSPSGEDGGRALFPESPSPDAASGPETPEEEEELGMGPATPEEDAAGSDGDVTMGGVVVEGTGEDASDPLGLREAGEGFELPLHLLPAEERERREAAARRAEARRPGADGLFRAVSPSPPPEPPEAGDAAAGAMVVAEEPDVIWDLLPPKVGLPAPTRPLFFAQRSATVCHETYLISQERAKRYDAAIECAPGPRPAAAPAVACGLLRLLARRGWAGAPPPLSLPY